MGSNFFLAFETQNYSQRHKGSNLLEKYKKLHKFIETKV